MNQVATLASVLDWIVLVGFFSAFLFIPVVSLFWPWWKEPFGRAVMTMEGLIGLALLPATLRRLFGISLDDLGFLYFEVIVLGCIPLRLFWLLRSIWKLQGGSYRAIAEQFLIIVKGKDHDDSGHGRDRSEDDVRHDAPGSGSTA